MSVTRRRLLERCLALSAGLGAAGLGIGRALGEKAAVAADEMRFFRIGTGSTGGTYYPVGGLLASAISNPPGSHPCEEGGACGVPGLIAVAQTTEGSVDNVQRMEQGLLESALCQADVAYWAATGQGGFTEHGPVSGLGVISNLFPELLHLVVRRGAGIRSVKDLKGHRISLDTEGSGTRVDALLVLAAYGLDPRKMEVVTLASGQSAEAIRKDELDAFFMVAGAPVSVIEELAAEHLIDLLPINGPEAELMTKEYTFLTSDLVLAGTYANIPATPTLSVGALWLVSLAVDPELVYAITATLWKDETRQLLDAGHPRATQIRIETALRGVAEPPLHPGAERYYREKGLL
ncbi:MAG TPA: TAXI family TRAP transporter solute-binding subunit [Kiloniellales bacterium]|nr:TAXI family TRAP transporter solute-binding subunit [Kiloniellales bacterium]